jgi:hypothetical protein
MKINITFEGPPGPDGPRFIETEDLDGRGVGAGEWIKLSDGRWALQVDVNENTIRRS